MLEWGFWSTCFFFWGGGARDACRVRMWHESFSFTMLTLFHSGIIVNLARSSFLTISVPILIKAASKGWHCSATEPYKGPFATFQHPKAPRSEIRKVDNTGGWADEDMSDASEEEDQSWIDWQLGTYTSSPAIRWSSEVDQGWRETFFLCFLFLLFSPIL